MLKDKQPRLPFPNWDSIELRDALHLNKIEPMFCENDHGYTTEAEARWLWKAIHGRFAKHLAPRGNNFHTIRFARRKEGTLVTFVSTQPHLGKAVAHVNITPDAAGLRHLYRTLRFQTLKWQKSKWG